MGLGEACAEPHRAKRPPSQALGRGSVRLAEHPSAERIAFSIIGVRVPDAYLANPEPGQLCKERGGGACKEGAHELTTVKHEQGSVGRSVA